MITITTEQMHHAIVLIKLVSLFVSYYYLVLLLYFQLDYY